MNRINNYKQLLELANDEIGVFGFIIVLDEEEGFYDVNIKHGEETTCFASNYYEDELSSCVNEAWSFVLSLINNI